MRVMTRLLVVLIAVVAAGCMTETESFLSDPGARPNDKRVLGSWYWRDRAGREITVMHVRPGENGRLSVTWVEMKPGRAAKGGDAPVHWIRFHGHTTRIGKANFANLTFVGGDPEDRVPKRFIMRYWVTKAGLRLAFMDDRTVREAIKSGKLKGRLGRHEETISASRKELIAFLRQVGPNKVFNKPTKPMKRMAATAR